MKNFIIKLLQKKKIFLSRTNWKQFYFNRIGKEKLIISFDEIIKKFITYPNPIIFDVGANKGETIERFNRIFEATSFHCFEPNKIAFDILKKFENDKIKINNFALGDKIEKKNFFNYPKTSSSGFYSINQNSKIYDINKNFSNSTVEVSTVDRYCEDNGISKIDILKIDTQGHEKFVLIGSKKIIQTKNINFIEIEIHLGNQYNRNPTTFYEIEEILNKDYRLIGIDRHGNVIGDMDFQFNALYASRNLF